MNNAHMRMISLHIFLNYDEEIKENKMHVGDHHASKMFLLKQNPFLPHSLSNLSPSSPLQSIKKNNLETIKNNSHEWD